MDPRAFHAAMTQAMDRFGSQMKLILTTALICIQRVMPMAHMARMESIIFNVPGRTGMGLHSGRANSGAQNHPTLGCIRTTDAAMGFVRNLITTDPVTSMTVINNNVNAPQFGTQQ